MANHDDESPDNSDAQQGTEPSSASPAEQPRQDGVAEPNADSSVPPLVPQTANTPRVVRRSLDELGATASKALSATSSVSLMAERMLAQQRDIERMLEPPAGVKAFLEEHERQVRMARLMTPDLSMYEDPSAKLLKHFREPTLLEQALAADSAAFLKQARAYQATEALFTRQYADAATAALTEFRRPAELEIERAVKAASLGAVGEWAKQQAEQQLGLVASIEREKLRADSFTQALSAIEAPWLRMEQEQQSLRAMVELSSIGDALKLFQPFDTGFTESLRADLGDWRFAPEPDPAVYVDAVLRGQYYVEQGFNEALTDFPEEAFAEGLSASELGDNYLEIVDVEELLPPSLDAEAEASAQRATYCYTALRQLEVELRGFIDGLMTAAFGPNWVSQHVDAKTQEAWAGKQQAAAKNKRPFDRLIDAADFTDYAPMMCRKEPWRLFKPYFVLEESLRESLRRVGLLRLDTMHARSVTKKDVVYVAVETSRLLDTIRSSPPAA